MTTTFEQWLAEHDIPSDFDYVDELRTMWEASAVRREHQPLPTQVPDCPAWCVDAPGHEYTLENFDDLDRTDDLPFVRDHVGPYSEDLSGYVEQQERWRGGSVTSGPALITVTDALSSETEISADEARRRAATLLDLADQLDRITSTT
jgi:hypothetical protein